MKKRDGSLYDPEAKEAQLRAESEAGDTFLIEPARPDDFPIIDLGPDFSNESGPELEGLAD